jgi:hypothetical protein
MITSDIIQRSFVFQNWFHSSRFFFCESPLFASCTDTVELLEA